MIDLTLLNHAVFLWGAYYALLFVVLALGRWRRRMPVNPDTGSGPVPPPAVVMVVPAHNEEDVIGHTLRALLANDYPALTVLVMNDGSEDRTSEIARSFSRGRKVIVVDRDAAFAGHGKGAVLNDAYARVVKMVRSHKGPLAGRDPSDVILGVMDADGQLESEALQRVVPLFADPIVGGVQTGVRIANVRHNILTRLQDMEFIGFSAFVQEARDLIGSVGLGGNGQFTRLSALRSLDREPWTDCLTEDLDLGLSLVEQGWRIRFAADTYVAQQGVVSLGPLLRQRTRWVQGHYQCWSHIPELLDSDKVSVRTRLDLILYLVLAMFVLLITAGVVLSILSVAGVISTTSTFMGSVPVGPMRNGLQVLLSLGPLLVFLGAYQAKAAQRFRWWELPAFGTVFSLYTYLFVASHVWAMARMVTRRRSWEKTPRTEAESAV